MSQSVRYAGDPIERTYATFIESRLPAYTELWSHVLGNDGTSHLPRQDRFKEPVNALRRATSQHAYAALVSAIALDRLAAGAFEAQPLEAYLGSVDRVVAFHAHLGHIRDCVVRLGELWGLGDLAQALNAYLNRRCTALNDPLAPFSELCGAFALVRREGEAFEAAGAGGRKGSDADAGRPRSPQHCMSETGAEVVALLNAALGRVHVRACQGQEAVVAALQDVEPMEFSDHAETGVASALSEVAEDGAGYQPLEKPEWERRPAPTPSGTWAEFEAVD